MINVALTGGIGSGKTTVSGIFSRLGVPVFDTDSSAKRLMEQCMQVKSAIVELLGEESYADGRPDRTFIASRVFTDSRLLDSLNRIVHPAVARDFLLWADKKQYEGHPYVIMETAILFESGFDRHVEAIITVSAPREVRMERVMQRDSLDQSQVEARMDRQMSDEQREALADFVIFNPGDRLLVPAVVEIDEQLRNKK